MNDPLALFGTDLFGEIIKPKASGPVAERFTFPPFSVLDARQGEWQERKRAWLLMGIEGEVGRDGGLLGRQEDSETNRRREILYGKKEGALEGACSIYTTPTSVFDPVICELAYRWFCPKGGQVVDPFAGGSVRGVVAKSLGMRYWGCDLRPEQVSANVAQAEEIFEGYEGRSLYLDGFGPDLEWVCGDSMEILATAPDADMVFSCPPYGDLEVYSDDPADLSNMEWHTFVAAYKRIILRCVQRMKPNTFACFVVGDFRDPRGFYRNFVSETIDGFQQAGAKLYNEAVLVTSVGTAALRVTRQFNSGRKLCKTHQNVLVFCKGDWRQAARACIDSGDDNE